jgi:hypothetical protein
VPEAGEGARPAPARAGGSGTSGGTDSQWLAAREGRAAALLGAAAVLAVLVSFGSAGMVGLVVSLSVVAVLGLLAAVLGLPGAPPRTRPPRRLPTFDEPYPSFQAISEQLSWSQVSPRHYDLVTRPLLVRLMTARLADHHGIELAHSPDAARALLGDELWWWVDPTRPPQRSSQPPGIDVGTLTRVVEALERL